MLPDKEFEEQLAFSDLIEKYRQEVSRAEAAIRDDYRKNGDAKAELKVAGLETERAHRDLLNVAVFPFVRGSPGADHLNYHFIRGSPLSEMGLKNFDFLLAKLPPTGPVRIIAGEAKTSVGKPGALINEVVTKRQVLEANKAHVLSTYLHQPPEREWVIEALAVVDSVDAPTVLNAAVQADSHVIVWHAPSGGEPELNIASPPNAVPNAWKYRHADNALNDLLRHCPSVRRTFDIWPSSHPFIRLGALITAATQGANGKLVIRRDFLDTVLRRDMFYASDAERSAIAEAILKQGQAIGFLGPSDLPEELRVVARGVRRDTIEQRLREKWVKWQLGEDEKSEAAAARAALQVTYLAERAKRKNLADFM